MNAVKQIKKERDPYAFSRLMYIIEATVEYFISLVVADAYLAKVCASVGMSDAMTGVLSSFVHLGCGMQIIAIFMSVRKSAKRFVISGTAITNLIFVIVYLTPFFPARGAFRITALVVVLLLAQFVKNIVHSHKINWFMSLVDDKQRGIFTANKEIVSLISGMIFTFAMGVVIDAFEAAGNLEGAFVVSAITVFVLGVIHILTMILSKEKIREIPQDKEKNNLHIRAILSNRNLLKVSAVAIVWTVASSVSTPFYGAYKIGGLGFSMTAVSIIGIVSSLTRALFSRPIGRFADRRSFSSSMILCLLIASAGFLACAFAAPGSGKIAFCIYSILNAISMAGINSGLINLVYDYVPHEQRVAALAIQNSVAGVLGFGTTCLVGILVDHIQKNGNVFFGVNIAAQQVVSVIAMIITLLLTLYLVFVIRKISKVK